MTIYNIKYIRDCTEYNYFINKIEPMNISNSFLNYDNIVTLVFGKIKQSASNGISKTNILYEYDVEYLKAQKFFNCLKKCIIILTSLLESLGYKCEYCIPNIEKDIIKEMPRGNNRIKGEIDINISW